MKRSTLIHYLFVATTLTAGTVAALPSIADAMNFPSPVPWTNPNVGLLWGGGPTSPAANALLIAAVMANLFASAMNAVVSALNGAFRLVLWAAAPRNFPEAGVVARWWGNALRTQVAKGDLRETETRIAWFEEVLTALLVREFRAKNRKGWSDGYAVYCGPDETDPVLAQAARDAGIALPLPVHASTWVKPGVVDAMHDDDADVTRLYTAPWRAALEAKARARVEDAIRKHLARHADRPVDAVALVERFDVEIHDVHAAFRKVTGREPTVADLGNA